MSVSKGARLLGFLLSRVRGVLHGISSIPLDLASFGGPNLVNGVPKRCSYYPQCLVRIHGANRETRGLLFIPSCPGLTSLTGAYVRFDRCKALMGSVSGKLPDSCVFGLGCCWSILGRFRGVLLGFVKGFFSCSLSFGGGFCSRS
jgi:hypothetical protein